ncbi:hypothetical protein [Actinoplanes derwentensis]|uniref:hypothetical protein n=1 Tax=Actinoplanes derwentensis TaxID=113562 RepID=UPI0012FE3FD0|nr:hypothetical protein [Actinoplanes derwentensis]
MVKFAKPLASFLQASSFTANAQPGFLSLNTLKLSAEERTDATRIIDIGPFADREGVQRLDDFDAVGQRLTASGTTRLDRVRVADDEVVPRSRSVCSATTPSGSSSAGSTSTPRRFGAAFHDGSWKRGFDHAETLRRITCPVLLLQANFEVRADGVLDGAMTEEEAGRCPCFATAPTTGSPRVMSCTWTSRPSSRRSARTFFSDQL